MKKIMKLLRLAFCLSLLCLTGEVRAEYGFDIGGTFCLGAGSNEFAPFYLHTNNHGKLSQANNARLDLWAIDSLDISKRFDFSWGVEMLVGYANKADYRRWDSSLNEFYPNPIGPSPIWLQQLFAEVKWRSLFLSVGMKDRDSWFVDQNLSSGDMLWSGNARGIPEVRIGFIDFQNIPLTKGWVQIDAVLSYGKFMDNKFNKNLFDYYSGTLTWDDLWTYKRISLRTKPTQPFYFQFGFQMAGIFGGYMQKYYKGQPGKIVKNYNGFKDFLLMIWPLDTKTHEGNKTGDHKGTWDIAAHYRFKGGETLRAYTQWFWEDGSGLLKENGWDGLWGLEFKLNRRWWITGAVAEYLDLTNMSGPMAYEPGYNNSPGGASLPYRTHGADGYYNNEYYRSYVNYGLNMGTPLVQGTLFNTGYDHPFLEGSAYYSDLMPNNGSIPYFRVKAFHIAIEGALGPHFDYIVKYNHRKAWGHSWSWALIKPVQADSFMAGATYNFPNIRGLSLSASLGIDKGNIPSNAFGGLITITYQRPVIFKKK